jgi:predicted nucleic-acid-binding Zn-ribbon protein
MAKQIKCRLCEDELDKIAVGLNKKLFGIKLTRFYCMSCLANYLDVTVEELFAKAEEFKEQGCKLFS